MRIIFTIAVSIIFTVLISLNCFAEKVVFSTTVYPPYLTNENGKISGLQADVVRAVCKHLGVEPVIKVLPWERALHQVKNGQVDGVFMPVYTKERAEYIHYTSESPTSAINVISAKKGSGIKASSLDDLKGMTVGMIRGYSYGEKFDNFQKINKEPVNANDNLIKKLARGRNKLVASDQGIIKYLGEKEGFEVETVITLQNKPQFIGFSKAIGKKGIELAERFSKAIKELKENGVIGQIESKYLD